MLSAVQALSNDAAFVRVRKGVYALRALAGNVGPVPHNTPKSSRPPLGRGWDHRDSYRCIQLKPCVFSRASCPLMSLSAGPPNLHPCASQGIARE